MPPIWYVYSHNVSHIHKQYSADAGECTIGDVRLVNGTTENEGLVEYCYKGQWAQVCSLDTHAASLICHYLGHTQYSCEP